nr:hypothetical protein Iba_chr10bCG7640 [Ipomoea batatas]GMD46926.1 hypothetical protein Iba_chr10eCG8000 [Ipomoea batatas]
MLCVQPCQPPPSFRKLDTPVKRPQEGAHHQYGSIIQRYRNTQNKTGMETPLSHHHLPCRFLRNLSTFPHRYHPISSQIETGKRIDSAWK